MTKKSLDVSIKIDSETTLVEGADGKITEITRWYWEAVTTRVPDAQGNTRCITESRNESNGGCGSSLTEVTSIAGAHVTARLQRLYITRTVEVAPAPTDGLLGYDPSEIIVGPGGQTLADAAKLENDRKNK